jgi:hypothetical protein
MIKNKFLLKQLIWLIKEEKNFYDNYNNYLIINYVNYIETLYSIIESLD